MRAEHVCRPWPNLATSEAVGDPCSWIPWELGIPGVQIFFFLMESLRDRDGNRICSQWCKFSGKPGINMWTTFAGLFLLCCTIM